MKKILILVTVVLLGLQGFVLAAEPVSKTPDLELLGKYWEESRNKYRDALEEKRGSIETALQQKESLLVEEGDAHERKTILDTLHSMRSERDDLNDKIRAINAGDVVKFANGRDKIISTLTGQTPV